MALWILCDVNPCLIFWSNMFNCKTSFQGNMFNTLSNELTDLALNTRLNASHDFWVRQSLKMKMKMSWNECAKFRGFRAIVGLEPLCNRAFVDLKFFLVNFWVSRGSEIFSCGCFVGQNFLFSGYFGGLKFLLVRISWV